MNIRILLLVSLLIGGWITRADYSVIALGDIHFDGDAYHTPNAGRPYQQRERARNFKMWKSGKSGQLLQTAGWKVTADTAFVVQLGDFTQGDCDSKLLQEKMFRDGFATVKKYFPNHKLLAVKGNHDVRVPGVKGHCNEPAENAFLPLIANELGRKQIAGNYVVRQEEDLFIFFDGFTGSKAAEKFVRKALADNPHSRYTFFITHLPVLSCSGNVTWLTPANQAIRKMLARRNAVILTAHTHVPSFISVETPHGKLSQLVVCSMGSQWDCQGTPQIKYDTFEKFRKSLDPEYVKQTAVQKRLNEMAGYRMEAFEIYTRQSGFAVIKVNDREVAVEMYGNDSGKPWRIKTVRENQR